MTVMPMQKPVPGVSARTRSSSLMKAHILDWRYLEKSLKRQGTTRRQIIIIIKGPSRLRRKEAHDPSVSFHQDYAVEEEHLQPSYWRFLSRLIQGLLKLSMMIPDSLIKKQCSSPKIAQVPPSFAVRTSRDNWSWRVTIARLVIWLWREGMEVIMSCIC